MEFNYYDNDINNDNLDKNNMYIFFYNSIRNFFTIVMVCAGGLSISTLCVSLFLYRDYMSYKNLNADFSDSDSDSDSDYDSDSRLYEEKYMNKYENLDNKSLTDIEIDQLKNCFISNKTPKGIIKMSYDKINNAFYYYTNFKDIPYKYLETAGRFYVIKYDCKMLFVNSKDEYDKAVKVKENKLLEKKEQEEKKQELEESRKNSIFARFKSYNTDTVNNNNSNIDNISIVPEKSNKYIYKGKLTDFDEYINNNQDTQLNNNQDTQLNNNNLDEDFENLDYATFKKLEEKKNS